MVREDIKIIHKERMIVVQSNKHFFSFSRNQTGTIEAFCSIELTPEIIKDIILSGIVSIQRCEKGNLVMSSKFGYNFFKMQEVIIAVFEKFNL
jgi:hypothetical protein